VPRARVESVGQGAAGRGCSQRRHADERIALELVSAAAEPST
jgi:hypothetical protein